MPRQSSRFHCRTQCLGLSFANELPMEEAAVFAITAGGVEVAEPVAFFQSSRIHRLTLGNRAHDLPDLIHRPAHLIDDGLAPAIQLAEAARLIRAAGPSVLRLAIPWLRKADRRLLEPRFDSLHLKTQGVPRSIPYDDPPSEYWAQWYIALSQQYPGMADLEAAYLEDPYLEDP